MGADYAHALYTTLSNTSPEKADAVISAFMSLLKKEGKQKALPSIMRELKRLIAKESGQAPILYIAREHDAKEAQKDLATHLDTPQNLQIEVDDTLIGGWRYLGTDTLIDTSYKKALLALHRRITTT